VIDLEALREHYREVLRPAVFQLYEGIWAALSEACLRDAYYRTPLLDFAGEGPWLMDNSSVDLEHVSYVDCMMFNGWQVVVVVDAHSNPELESLQGAVAALQSEYAGALRSCIESSTTR
jgi:hypothetical protein